MCLLFTLILISPFAQRVFLNNRIITIETTIQMIKSSFFRLKKKQTNVLACWGNKCKPNFPEIKLHYLWLINWAHRDVRECFGDFRFTCFYMTEFFCSSLLKRATVFMRVLWVNFPCKFGAYLLRLTRAIMYFDGCALSRCVWVFSLSFIYFFGFIYDCDCFFSRFFHSSAERKSCESCCRSSRR